MSVVSVTSWLLVEGDVSRKMSRYNRPRKPFMPLASARGFVCNNNEARHDAPMLPCGMMTRMTYHTISHHEQPTLTRPCVCAGLRVRQSYHALCARALPLRTATRQRTNLEMSLALQIAGCHAGGEGEGRRRMPAVGLASTRGAGVAWKGRRVSPRAARKRCGSLV